MNTVRERAFMKELNEKQNCDVLLNYSKWF